MSCEFYEPLSKFLILIFAIHSGLCKDVNFSIGELLATISAASSFATPYIPQDRTASKLSVQQCSFSGNRFSDHVALICVYNRWREAFDQDPVAEKNVCERFSLNSTVLRMIRYFLFRSSKMHLTYK